jgi:hypothetical protein
MHIGSEIIYTNFHADRENKKRRSYVKTGKFVKLANNKRKCL